MINAAGRKAGTRDHRPVAPVPPMRWQRWRARVSARRPATERPGSGAGAGTVGGSVGLAGKSVRGPTDRAPR